MKKSLAFGAMKNMVCSIAVLLPLQLNMGTLIPALTTDDSETTITSTTDEIPLSDTSVVLLDLNKEYCDTNCVILQNKELIEFLCKTFGVSYDNIYNDLILRNSDVSVIETNMGRLTDKNGELKNYSSIDEGLIEYFYEYCKINPKNVNNTRIPYTGGADYVVSLIGYFTSVYNNVDYLTAVSIGAAESGYYKVSYMLKCNNVYGGMSNSGLIKHKNIEYGVLSYIRLLSKNYYGKGLDTLESIGRVYCPTYNSNGVKVASPHWINLVNKAKSYYEGSTTITIEQLLND